MPLSMGRWWLKTTSITERDYVNAASNSTLYLYDSYGNVTGSTMWVGENLNGGGTAQAVEGVASTYGSYHNNCHPGKLLTTTTSNTRNGQSSVSKTLEYTYENGGWKMIQKKEWPGLAKEVITDYSNHVFGLAQKFTTSSAGLPTLESHRMYDSKGRYIEQKINVDGQVELATYDPASGKLLSRKGIEMPTEFFTYDEFFRPKTFTDILGHVETTTRIWDLHYGVGTNPYGAENALYHVNVVKTGSPPVDVYYDLFDRERKTVTIGFSGQTIGKVTTYDKHGMVKTTTSPFVNSVDAVVATRTYSNVLRRLETIDYSPFGPDEQYVYKNKPGILFQAKHSVVKTIKSGISVTTEADMTGLIVSSTDNGGTTEFTYDSWGNTIQVQNGNGPLSAMTFDIYGRQTQLNTYVSASTSYEYNAYGQLISQTDGLNNTRVLSYDNQGRVTEEVGPEGTTSYTYIVAGPGVNKLSSVQAFNGITKSYTYDALHRLKSESSTMGYSLTKSYSYDPFGRLKEELYSTGFSIQHNYNSWGYHEKIHYANGSGTQMLGQVLSTNALGQVNSFKLGNGLTSVIGYDRLGIPLRYITPNNIQDLEMEWDYATSNLTMRKDYLVGLTEDFTYDNDDLQRLVSSTIAGGSSLGVSYNPNGDMIDKHDAGSDYDYFGQFAIRKAKNDLWNIPLTTQTVSYTTFNEPDEIEEDIHRTKFVYGPGRQRMQSKFYENGNSTITELRHYLTEMGYEMVKKNGQEYHLHYVPLFGNSMAIIMQQPATGESPSQTSMLYVYKDHIGSWLSIADNFGQVVAKQNFDAWGRRRDVTTWTYGSISSPKPWLIRGYTGHEMFDQFDIIHMNGRLYDPVVGRMFSPDNHVQNPYFSQSYNRYSYVLNNPLKFTDPSGEITAYDIIAGAAIVGGAILIGTGVASGIGTALVVAGVMHFYNTLGYMAANGTGWNQSSRQAGIAGAVTTTFAGTTGPGNAPSNTSQGGPTGINWSSRNAQRGYERNYHMFETGPSYYDKKMAENQRLRGHDYGKLPPLDEGIAYQHNWENTLDVEAHLSTTGSSEALSSPGGFEPLVSESTQTEDKMAPVGGVLSVTQEFHAGVAVSFTGSIISMNGQSEPTHLAFTFGYGNGVDFNPLPSASGSVIYARSGFTPEKDFAGQGSSWTVTPLPYIGYTGSTNASNSYYTHGAVGGPIGASYLQTYTWVFPYPGALLNPRTNPGARLYGYPKL